MAGDLPVEHPDHVCDQCRRAAAICYRRSGDRLEFLLVRTNDGRRWTFPKGRLEPGEQAAEAALREALEEAGVQGRGEEVPVTRYRNPGGARPGSHSQAVDAFLLEVSPDASLGSAEPARDPSWLDAKEALERLALGRQPDDAASHQEALRAALRKLHAPEVPDC